MLTVACVCVPGGEYNMHHAMRLQRQVSDHLEQPHDFVILTQSDKRGWWAKIDLFEPGHFEGRVLYLDLDVTITGSLDDLADYPAPFVAVKDYINPLKLNSSVMAWDAGAGDRIYEDFTSGIMTRFRGDQDWITHKVPEAARFPKDWCFSYRMGIEKGFPDDMRVCVFHGRPKPWEIADVA